MKKPEKLNQSNSFFHQRHPLLWKTIVLLFCSALIFGAVLLEKVTFEPWLAAKTDESLVSFARGSGVILTIPALLLLLIGTLTKDTRFREIYKFAAANFTWTGLLALAFIPLSIFVPPAVRSHILPSWGYIECPLSIGDRRYGEMWAKSPKDCRRDYIGSGRLKEELKKQ
jgi:magnesium-transporting ATPase (P-type)